MRLNTVIKVVEKYKRKLEGSETRKEKGEQAKALLAKKGVRDKNALEQYANQAGWLRPVTAEEEKDKSSDESADEAPAAGGQGASPPPDGDGARAADSDGDSSSEGDASSSEAASGGNGGGDSSEDASSSEQPPPKKKKKAEGAKEKKDKKEKKKKRVPQEVDTPQRQGKELNLAECMEVFEECSGKVDENKLLWSFVNAISGIAKIKCVEDLKVLSCIDYNHWELVLLRSKTNIF